MKKNISFSLLSFASSLILAFFLSPMILRNLGDVRYGVWALFGEILSYYGLLDLGVRGAINYFAGRTLALQDETGIRRYVSSGFYGLLGLSIVAFVATVILIFAFQNVLVPDGVNRAEILASACVFVGLFCASLPMETFAAVLVGSRRAYVVSSAELVSRLLSTALMYAALKLSPNMLLLCAAQLAGRLYYWAVIVNRMRLYVPEANISFRSASVQAFRDLLRYGSKNAAIAISGLVANRKDVTLISIFLGPQWVATFTFARMAVQSLAQACSSITQPVRPNLIYHWARGEYDQAYSILYTMTRYSSFVVLMVTAFLLPFESDFLRLWIGPRFVTGDVWFRADVVLLILLANQVPRMIYSMSWQLLFAQDRQKLLTILTWSDALVNTGLAIWLVRSYGTVGLAIAALIPTLVSQYIVFPLMLRRLGGVSLRRFAVEGVARPFLGAVVVAAAGFLLRQWIPVHAWRELFLNGAILATLALAIGATLVIRPEDRRRGISMLTSLRSRGSASASA